ncbi:MAG: HlyD family type I secretion periplasmic adaptor subunit [Azonexus sp.]
MFKLKSKATDLEVTDVTPIQSETDQNHHRASRIGWWLLIGGFGTFMLWAAFAPLDQGVSTTGQVVVSGNRKTVQHLSGGIVESILVKEGDEVKAGQTLVRMNTTQSKSQFDTARAQWMVARSVESRLQAERDDRASVVFPSDLVNEQGIPAVASAMALQGQLFNSRRASLNSELSVIDETIAGLEYMLRGFEANKSAKEEQVRLLREEIVGQRELVKDGFLARNRLSEQERLQAQLSGSLSEDIANLGRTQRSIAEAKTRKILRKQDYRKDVETQLTEVQKEAGALASRIQALRFDLENTEVKSPTEGIIVSLNVHTVGGVVQPASILMEVVPKDEPLRIESQIPSHLIDKLHPGLQVEIMFPALNQRITPQVPGKVLTVSADVLTDPQGRFPPYYKAQVEVTPEGMKKLKDQNIRAGMPAETFIRTGERTMLNYLFKPIADRLHASLNEV